MFKLTKRQARLTRWTAAIVAVVGTMGFLLIQFGNRPDPSARGDNGEIAGLTNVLHREAVPEEATIRMEEVSETTGVNFQHFPVRRESLLPEDMGSGVAWGDYDNDGDPDLFLVNFSAPITAPLEAATATSRLYRNDGGRFQNVTQEAGLAEPGYGMGAAWGDYDNDGDRDLYVTHFGPNRLYQNNGDGTFSETGVVAGVADDRFGSGCAWMDDDRDGFIDLYVCNYVEFQWREADKSRVIRQYGSEIPYTLNPSSYKPAANCLYLNNGDGTFTDVSAAAGVANPDGRSLCATWADLDNDGWPDLYVANDVSNNAVYRNRGDGTFGDIGASSLAADYRGAMGIAVGDSDADGDQDLFITHWLAQENALYENNISLSDPQVDASTLDWLSFTDRADEFGLGQISLDMVGWSTSFGDFDNDGYADLWCTNGSTLEDVNDHSQLAPQTFHFFRQLPGRGFYEMARHVSPAMTRPCVGRGGAQADYDGDGRLDLALSIHGGRAQLYRNISSARGSWIAVHLRQTGGNTAALGARVEVVTGNLRQTAQVGVNGGYLSQNALDLHFGIGDTTRVDSVTVHWPDGTSERLSDVGPNRLLVLEHAAQYGQVSQLADVMD